jgi:DNA primase
MRYPQTFIDDLKRQADIVRVVQDYVQLKKKGTNWMACCPFHKEKTPSFSVSPTKEIFYCFGCHKGGNVLNFVMEIERVAFPEAIKIVAEKTGMPLPTMVEDRRYEERRHEKDDVIQLNIWALEWWEEQFASTPEAKIAREYLERRQISEATRKTFRLAYAPDSWDALTHHLKKRGATQTQIERSGLVVKREDGKTYDRFRGRLISPVMDVQGRVIAFGGRTLKNEDAKYINSPETAAYVKGKNLFGLNLTRDEIRRSGFAILVEGFFDLIVPYQFGLRNVVATLGTALTADQAKLLSRFARKVVVNYDGDRAGVQAAKKSIEILLTEDLEVKVLVLPDDADPDEFIRKFGVSEYLERRARAQPHIQFVIDNALRDRSLHRPADKAEAVEEVLPYIRAVNNRVQKREYFDMAMDALRVTDLPLRRELWQSMRRGNAHSHELAQKTVRREFVKATIAEEQLLELLLAHESIRRTILPQLQKSDFEALPTAPIFKAIVEIDRERATPDLDLLTAKIGTEDIFALQLLPRLLIGDSANADSKEFDAQTAAQKCLDALRLVNVNRRIQEIGAELAAAERAGDDKRVVELSMQYGDLNQLRKSFEPQSQIAQNN